MYLFIIARSILRIVNEYHGPRVSNMKQKILQSFYKSKWVKFRGKGLGYRLLISLLGRLLRFARGWRYGNKTTKVISQKYQCIYIGNPK